MRKTLLFLIALLIVGLSTAPVQAELQTPGRATLSSPVPGTHITPTQPLPETKGALSWKVLGDVTMKRKGDRMVPVYTPAIQSLNQQEVLVQGFMMPLEPGSKQKHFLLTISPQTCAFCLPAGPEGMIEIVSKQAVAYTMEPIALRGKLLVLPDDPMGIYYRLTDVRPANNP